MLQSGIASVEKVDEVLSTSAGSRLQGNPLSPTAAADAHSVAGPLPVLFALLFAVSWTSTGMALALLSTVPVPKTIAVAWLAAGLAIATTLSMIVQHVLRRRAITAVLTAVAAQRAFLQEALDQLSEGLSIWDADDRLVMWNKRFGELMPRASAKLQCDMSYDELLQVWLDCGYAPAKAGPHWIQDCLERRWLGEAVDHRSFDDREFAFLEHTSDSGITTLSVSDITGTRARERALKDSEERYGLALIASNEALWDYDLRTDRSYLSPQALALIAVESSNPAPSRAQWSQFVHPEDVEHQQSAWENHLSGQTEVYSVEYRIVGPDGQIRWVYDRGLALRDSTGSPYRIAGSLGDISARKQTERALTDARDAAQLADRARIEFFSNITHELKTPLNIVIGFSQMLVESGADDLSEDERRAYAEEVRQAGTRLDRLVSDLLDLARAGSAETALADSQVDLRRCLSRATDLVSHRAEARGVKIDLLPSTEPLHVIGDQGKLKHALFNLLGYAIARSDAASAITVHAEQDLNNDAAVRIAFMAQGISDSQLRSALQPLTPDASTGNQRADGVDLALAVAESFIKLHGGTLELSSDDGKRVAAILRIPEERAA